MIGRSRERPPGCQLTSQTRSLTFRLLHEISAQLKLASSASIGQNRARPIRSGRIGQAAAASGRREQHKGRKEASDLLTLCSDFALALWRGAARRGQKPGESESTARKAARLHLCPDRRRPESWPIWGQRRRIESRTQSRTVEGIGATPKKKKTAPLSAPDLCPARADIVGLNI